MRSLRRAGLSNAAFRLGSSSLNFLLVPLYLRVYGLETFGSLSLLLSLGQYLSFLDLGFSSALVREALRLRSAGIGSYFLFRRAIAVAIVLVGAAVTTLAACTAGYWGPLLRIGQVSDLRLGVYGAGLITVLGLIAGLLNSAFVSNLRFGYAGAVNLLVNHVPQLTCLVAYVSGKTLGASLLMGGLATGFVVIAQIVVLWDEESGMEPTGSSAEWEGLWPFVGATVGFSLQTITSALVMPLLQTIVGAKLGPQANGLLDVSRRLLFAGRQAVEGLFVPVFSRTTALLERRQVGDIRRLAKSTAVASVVAAVSYFLGFTVFLPVIVRLWLGTDRAGPVLVAARVLLYGASFTCLNIGTFYVLSAFPKGRRVNAVAGTVTLAVLLIGFLQPIRTFKEITTVYAVATLAGSLLTMGLAFRLLPRLLVLRTPAA